MRKPRRTHSPTGNVNLSGEKVGIQATTIAGDCVFTGQVIIITGLDITGTVNFSGPVPVEPGGSVVITGETWKGRA